VDERDPTDYRFLLANERTFLAYLRTALALQIAGAGVIQFLTRGHDVVRLGLGLALVLTGSLLAVIGYFRWRGTERAIRSNRDISSMQGAVWVAAVVVVAPLAAAVVLALT
jgi:putative membrane protein